MLELEARLRVFEAMLARFPNTRLELPKLTLASWVKDTAHLPLEELRACVQYAIEHNDRGFVPTSGQVLAAFVERRSILNPFSYNAHCTIEERSRTLAARARRELADLRHQRELRLLGSGLIEVADSLLDAMQSKRLARETA